MSSAQKNDLTIQNKRCLELFYLVISLLKLGRFKSITYAFCSSHVRTFPGCKESILLPSDFEFVRVLLNHERGTRMM